MSEDPFETIQICVLVHSLTRATRHQLEISGEQEQSNNLLHVLYIWPLKPSSFAHLTESVQQQNQQPLRARFQLFNSALKLEFLVCVFMFSQQIERPAVYLRYTDGVLLEFFGIHVRNTFHSAYDIG